MFSGKEFFFSALGSYFCFYFFLPGGEPFLFETKRKKNVFHKFLF